MRETSLVPATNTGVTDKRNLATIGKVARQVARQHALKNYHAELSDNTLKRHIGDLGVFSKYLYDAGENITAEELMYDLEMWAGATEGLLEGFKEWMLGEGYSMGSINIRLATVKRYCAVAAAAGYVDASDLGLIQRVYGYRDKGARNVDEKREIKRIGNKKATPASISRTQLEKLLNQDDSRDALLMYTLLRLGFRVGEVASLEVSDFDIETGYVNIYRRKTNRVQTHRLDWGGLELLRRYLDEYKPQGKLFSGYRKREGTENTTALTVRGIQARVKKMGEEVGISNLSPHDCRHDLASRMAREGTHIKAMQDAGGWTSPYMPLRYAESAKIANEGVIQ